MNETIGNTEEYRANLLSASGNEDWKGRAMQHLPECQGRERNLRDTVRGLMRVKARCLGEKREVEGGKVNGSGQRAVI